METEDGTDFAELKRFETMIENVSNSTSEFLIRTLMEDYQLLDHCQALKRYLLLGQVCSSMVAQINPVGGSFPINGLYAVCL